MSLTARTGAVTSVDIVKSTGFRKLDDCAVAALRTMALEAWQVERNLPSGEVFNSRRVA